MGRRNSYKEPEFLHSPRISYKSRQLASASRKKRDIRASKKVILNGHLVTGEQPHYMQDTIARRESIVLPPLQRIKVAKAVYRHNNPFPNRFWKRSPVNSISNIVNPAQPNSVQKSKIHRLTLNFSLKGVENNNNKIMAKAAAISMRQSFDENPFTFKPKVSSASVRIVESLGSDFMSRQQQHIEKQKKHFEQANQFYVSDPSRGSRLSPVNRNKKVLSPTERNSKKEVVGSSSIESCTSLKAITMSNSNTSVTVKKPSNPRVYSSQGLQRLEASPYGAMNGQIFLNKQKTKINTLKKQNTSTVFSETNHDIRNQDEEPEHISHSRSRTMPPASQKMTRRLTVVNLDRVKNAKIMAERAVKHRKIFSIQGPYPAIRASLRRRGWVEKFYKMQGPAKKITKSTRKAKTGDSDDDNGDDDDDDGDDDGDSPDDYVSDENKLPPWLEEDGSYGIMSRIVRNVTPSFIWCIRRDSVDYRFLSNDQIINHYSRAGSFTTKVGLCTNMKNLCCFYNADPTTFFPRSFKLSMDEDKGAFIDDFRLTACMNIIKWVIYRCDGFEEDIEEIEKNDSDPNQNPPTSPPIPKVVPSNSPRKGKKKGGIVPMKALDLSLQQCTRWLQFKDNEDIDRWEDPYQISDSMWDQLIQWSYQLNLDGAVIPQCNGRLSECQMMADVLRRKNSQFDMDGAKNVWIVKPGAKSRGRGIMVFDRLEEMLKLVNTPGVIKKEGKYVVQKYIERPLLIYNTKFDIRQWFLVTDWNPLTFYFYKDCYLRFCTQQYTLEDLNESIHLCNNSIQKNYSNGPRSTHLPQDNMWDSEQFKEYLKRRGHEDVWDKVVYPGMKEAVLSALLCTQDIIEYKKSAFELYGADFMITEDFRPWLIEINCSPTMAPSTKVTTRLCNNVQEDTIRVVIDRKYDRNCNIGQFELAYKQSIVDVPPYIGLSLSIDGQGVRKPGTLITTRRYTCASLDVSSELMSSQSKHDSTNVNIKENNINVKHSPYLAASVTLERTNKQTPHQPLPFTYTKFNVKSPTQSSSTSSTALQQKDSITSASVKSSKSVIKKESNSSVTGSRSRENAQNTNSATLAVQVRQIPEREKLPMRMTNVDALDLKVALHTKGPLVIDGSWGQMCTICGNSVTLLHYDSEYMCKCRQDSIRSGVTFKRCRSASNSPRSVVVSPPRPPSSRAVPRDDILAAVYKRGSCGFEPHRTNLRKPLMYTDARIHFGRAPLLPSSRAITHAFPALNHQFPSSSRKNFGVPPFYPRQDLGGR